MQLTFMNNISPKIRGEEIYKALSDDPEHTNRKAFWNHYFKSISTLLGIHWDAFQLKLVAAWESDETHFRYVSIESEFNVGARKMGKYHRNEAYEPGQKWKPDDICLPPRARSRRSRQAPGISLGNWNSADTSDILPVSYTHLTLPTKA